MNRERRERAMHLVLTFKDRVENHMRAIEETGDFESDGSVEEAFEQREEAQEELLSFIYEEIDG